MNLNRISETLNEKLEELIRNKKLDSIQEDTLSTYNYIFERNQKLEYIKSIFSILREDANNIFEDYSDEKRRSLKKCKKKY